MVWLKRFSSTGKMVAYATIVVTTLWDDPCLKYVKYAMLQDVAQYGINDTSA
jgi:hypothetical protein